MIKVLFVCLGNICRSPAAEAVFKKIVLEHGNQNFQVDSAGTSAFHAGEKADSRMREHGKRRGFELTSISRQFTAQDFDRFDHIICMDEKNFRDAKKLANSDEQRAKIEFMLDYSHDYKNLKNVPDPYYGGDDGFETVFDMLEESCEKLYQTLK